MDLGLILWLAMAGYLFWKWLQYRAIHEAVEQEVLEELERRLPVGLTIEEIDGVVYGWNHKTMDFVCQGENMEQFRNAFRARYPNRSAAIIDGPEHLMTRFKTELKTILQNENLNSQ
jgi:hypothetical protein